MSPAGSLAPPSARDDDSRRHWPLSGVDAALCLVLTCAIFTYLWWWPRDFFAFDEGLYLYESRRLMEGAVFYRDILEIITPGGFYYLAFLFRIFGVTLLTAKMGMAAVHAAITVLLFLSCRRLAVRHSIALTAAVAHIAIAYPGMVIASPHWVGTLLTTLIVYLCLIAPWRRPGKAWLFIGLVNGALVMVQQQKGVVIAAGVCAVAVADHLFARRGESLRMSSLVARLAMFLGGVGLFAGPLTLALLWAAGMERMWEALIYFPLRNYPGFGQCRYWGYAGILGARAWMPKFVAAMPAIALLFPLRVGWSWLARKDPVAARPVTTLSLLLLAACGSVYYCPNYTHLVLIAPLGFVLLAEAVESSLGTLASRVSGGAPALAIAAAIVIAALGDRARTALLRRAAEYRFVHETEVGPVAFRNSEEITVLEALLERTEPDDEIFAYPTYPGIYFSTWTVNPTRFQIFLHDYHEPKHAREIIDVLEARKVAYVVVQGFKMAWRNDPIAKYLAEKYERVALPYSPSKKQFSLPAFVLFQRRM